MKRIRSLATIVAMVLATWEPTFANELSLKNALKNALDTSPEYLAVQAKQQEFQADADMAKARFMPQLSASILRGKANSTETQLNRNVQLPEAHYAIENKSLNLQQPLLNLATVFNYKQTQTRLEYGQLQIDQIEQKTAQKVLQQLLTLAQRQVQNEYGQAAVWFTHYKTQAIASGIKSGASNQLEKLQANAQYEISQAQAIEFSEAFEMEKWEFKQITGMDVSKLSIAPEKLTALIEKFSNWPINNVEKTLLNQNIDLLKIKSEIDIGAQEINKQKSNHIPVVSLIGRWGESESDTISTIGRQTEQGILGVQVEIPIFNGFGTVAATQKAASQLNQQYAQMESVRRDILYKMQTILKQKNAAQKKANGLAHALKAAEMAVIATSKGIPYGLNSQLELAENRERLSSAQRDFRLQTLEVLAKHIELLGLTNQLKSEVLESITQQFNTLLYESKRPNEN